MRRVTGAFFYFYKVKLFLEEVVDQAISQDHDPGTLCFVLPSRRAGVYVKELLRKKTTKTTFLPEILSVENFVESISGLKVVSNTVLLFELYQAYLAVTPKKDQDTFASFSSWAPTVIQDINEIDRFLIPQDKIFSYLSEIQDLNHWSMDDDPTPFVKKYLAFWKTLPILYQQFSNKLLSKGQATQGLCFREAYENIEHYIQSTPNRHHIFAGFNALNAAEEKIIQTLLDHERAEIFWDIDAQFLSDSGHAAGHFIRKYKNGWAHYKKHSFFWAHSHFSSSKQIHIIGTPKNISQAKQVGDLLQRFSNDSTDMSKTAVVLGDESLLLPTLHSIPETIQSANVTMGLSLKNVSLATFFDQFITLHSNPSKKGFYHKHVQHLLCHQNIKSLFAEDPVDQGMTFIQAIHRNNVIYVTQSYARAHFSKKHHPLIKLLFGDLGNPQQAVSSILRLIQLLKNTWIQNQQQHRLELEQLYLFYEIFRQLETLINTYSYVEDLQTLRVLYKELVSAQTLHFQGEPLQGLQLMGMLETRAIDFDTVIITSVNEGVLPAGKQPPTTIPFDVKKQFGLPTYEEKDAVYTYHFYRLLQRAKNIYLIYNNAAEGLNAAEKSRFLYQLQMISLPQHQIQSYFVKPAISIEQNVLKSVPKTPAIMTRLGEIATKGISPSSLNQYIRNPIAFFEQRVLGIQPKQAVEESPEAATFGTIVHEVLEEIYTPFIGQNLVDSNLDAQLVKLPTILRKTFSKYYPNENNLSGKNRIVFEVIQHQISQFVKAEITDLQAGHSIKIIALEKQVSATTSISGLNHPVRFSGIVDRIDERDGMLRIIDYKSGKVKAGDLLMMKIENITNGEKHAKALQVLLYGLMWNYENNNSASFEAGVVSFKNISAGFLRFGIRPAPRSLPKEYSITTNIVSEFEAQIKQVVMEIFDPSIPFVEKIE